MAGTMDEPMNGGAMGVFTSREAAEGSSPATRSW
jgi:hypothetical protein